MGAQFSIGIGYAANALDLSALPGIGYVAGTWMGPDTDIFLQRLDPNGNLFGGLTGFDNWGGDVSRPQVVGLSDGRFVFTWSSNKSVNGHKVYSLWFDQSGDSEDFLVPISDTDAFPLVAPATAPLGDGYVVAWMSL
jgi:hypothetical protein